MNSKIQNYLSMVRATLDVAQSSDYKAVWEGQPPVDFGTDLVQLSADYASVAAKAALIGNTAGGASDAKATAESGLEDNAYLVARALAAHFKKTADLVNLGKVNLTKSDIVRLRTQELVTLATTIRNLANETVDHPEAANRGLTPARIEALTASITTFSTLMSLPRGQIVNRSVLLKEVETDVAGLLTTLTDLEDFVGQFDTTETGKRFVKAWKQARIIVDVGGGRGNVPPAPATPSTPAPVAAPAH